MVCPSLFLAHITNPPSSASSWYREQAWGRGGWSGRDEFILHVSKAVRLAACDPAWGRDITQQLAAVSGSYHRGQMNEAELAGHYHIAPSPLSANMHASLSLMDCDG